MPTVKCLICDKNFDRTKEPCIKQGRRYMHKDCFEKQPEDFIYKQKILEKAEELFKNNCDYNGINSQIKNFQQTYGYTAKDIYKTLLYWYDVKNESIEKSMGRIGIVPYCYKAAQEYYSKIETAQNVNSREEIDKALNPDKVVYHIEPVPFQKPKRFRLFDLP